MNILLSSTHTLVTRPVKQADSLCRAIGALGGQVTHWPALVIEKIEETPITQKNIEKLGQYDLIFFISANAVEFGMQAIRQHEKSFAHIKTGSAVFAVGKATAKALQEAGVKQIFTPDVASSDGMLAMKELQETSIEGNRCLIFRGLGGREKLARELHKRNVQGVDYAEVYRRVANTTDRGEINGLIAENKLDVVIISSCAGLDSLFAIIHQQYRSQLNSITLLTVSDRVAEYAGKRGFAGQILVARSVSDEDIITTMQQWHRKRNIYE